MLPSTMRLVQRVTRFPVNTLLRCNSTLLSHPPLTQITRNYSLDKPGSTDAKRTILVSSALSDTFS